MYTEKEILDLQTVTGVIYRITNLINNKVYIGQTIKTFNERYEGRKNEVGIERVYTHYKNNVYNKHLLNSMNLYGLENFRVDILKRNLSVDELNYWEQLYIELYNSTDHRYGYNYQKGGNNHERVIDYEDLKDSLYKKIANKEKVRFMEKLLLKLEKKDINTRPIIDEIKNRKIVIIDTRDETRCWVYQNVIQASEIHTGGFRPDTLYVMAKHNENDLRFDFISKKKQDKRKIYFLDTIDISDKYVVNKRVKHGRTRIDYLPECRKDKKPKPKREPSKRQKMKKKFKKVGYKQKID